MAKKSNPFLEKKEEKDGKDLDGDGEKGEKKAHKAKVLGKKEIPSGGLKSSLKKCPKCKGMHPASHPHFK